MRPCEPCICELNPRPIIGLPEIIKRGCEFFNIEEKIIKGHCRKREIKDPRHMIITIAHNRTHKTLKVIGEEFGGRDHTTIINSKQVVSDLRATDEDFSETFTRLNRYIFS